MPPRVPNCVLWMFVEACSIPLPVRFGDLTELYSEFSWQSSQSNMDTNEYSRENCSGWFLWTSMFIYSCWVFPTEWSSFTKDPAAISFSSYLSIALLCQKRSIAVSIYKYWLQLDNYLRYSFRPGLVCLNASTMLIYYFVCMRVLSVGVYLHWPVHIYVCAYVW